MIAVVSALISVSSGETTKAEAHSLAVGAASLEASPSMDVMIIDTIKPEEPSAPTVSSVSCISSPDLPVEAVDLSLEVHVPGPALAPLEEDISVDTVDLDALPFIDGIDDETVQPQQQLSPVLIPVSADTSVEDRKSVV